MRHGDFEEEQINASYTDGKISSQEICPDGITTS
jgi:hypothetical protein